MLFPWSKKNAVENSLNDVEKVYYALLEESPRVLSHKYEIAICEINATLPSGINTHPCPATRAIAVDLLIKAREASSYDMDDVWMIATLFSLKFTVDDMLSKSTNDTKYQGFQSRIRRILGVLSLLTANSSTPSQKMGDAYKSFQIWYAAYVAAADSVKPGLGPMIDFMDHEPLKRAFIDQIDPMALGLEFAKGFNIEKFGK